MCKLGAKWSHENMPQHNRFHAWNIKIFFFTWTISPLLSSFWICHIDNEALTVLGFGLEFLVLERLVPELEAKEATDGGLFGVVVASEAKEAELRDLATDDPA